MDRLFLPIVGNVLLLLAALGFGRVLRGLFPPSFSQLDRLALTLLGGLGLLGTIFFGVGHVWFSPASVLFVMLVGLAFAFKWLTEVARGLVSNVTKIRVPALPAMVISAVLLMPAIGGLAEPVGDIKMDAIAYHFLGPKVWLRNGLIRPVIDEAFTSFPAIVETQYAALMFLGGQRTPGFFAVIALISLLLVTLALALRIGLNLRSAFWAAALIFAMPAVYRGAYGGFVDAIYSGFVLGAVRIGFDAERPAHYLLFGAFCGFAMGTKYTGLIAAVLLITCTFVVATAMNRHRRKESLRHLGVACAVAVVIGGPWYIRNWLLLGCPLYPPPPLLPYFFHVRYLPPEAIHFFHQSILRVGEGMGRGPVSLLFLPFHLTFHPANFLNGAGGIGLAPLALGAFGLLALRGDWFAKGLGLFLLLQTFVWFITEQEARFLIHVYVLGAIFAVCGWLYVQTAAPRFGPTLAGLTVGASLLYGLYMMGSGRVDDLHSVMSASFEDQRRHREIPFLDSFSYLNREVSVSRVLIIDPYVPAYYSDKSYIKPVGRWGEETLPDAANIGKLLSDLSQLYVSHVLDVRWPGGAFRIHQAPPNLRLIFEASDQRIYLVN